jgi:threonylcarbamoyladenosine tRNA methylthiotransferase MtaB
LEGVRETVRVAFATLGCRLNQFETQSMRHRLRREQTRWEVVGWDEPADVYVINSCAVTSRAEQKCRQMARQIKRADPAARVVVVGCYAQLEAERLSARPEIDGVLGNEEKRRLDLYLPRLLSSVGPLRAVEPYRRDQAAAVEWIDEFEGFARATIKVQEGCNLRCSFCTIWRARGPSRSRVPRDIVEQARRLAAAGHQEIVLAGVHLGHYGWDLEPRTELTALLEMLLELVPDPVRFRLSSVDPGEVDERLLELLAQQPRLCRYLHLPLQSGSDRVLANMRRHYRKDDVRRIVEAATRCDPTFGVGADLIVGFPGETEADFEETRLLLEGLAVSFYHVFRYSDRPGTPASKLGGHVPGHVAAARSRILRELGRRKRRSFLRRHIGRRADGIVETVHLGSRAEVMLDDYATVWVDAAPGLGRQRVEVLIDTFQRPDRLHGRILGVGDREAMREAIP